MEFRSIVHAHKTSNYSSSCVSLPMKQHMNRQKHVKDRSSGSINRNSGCHPNQQHHNHNSRRRCHHSMTDSSIEPYFSEHVWADAPVTMQSCRALSSSRTPGRPIPITTTSMTTTPPTSGLACCPKEEFSLNQLTLKSASASVMEHMYNRDTWRMYNRIKSAREAGGQTYGTENADVVQNTMDGVNIDNNCVVEKSLLSAYCDEEEKFLGEDKIDDDAIFDLDL